MEKEEKEDEEEEEKVQHLHKASNPLLEGWAQGGRRGAEESHVHEREAMTLKAKSGKPGKRDRRKKVGDVQMEPASLYQGITYPPLPRPIFFCLTHHPQPCLPTPPPPPRPQQPVILHPSFTPFWLCSPLPLSVLYWLFSLSILSSNAWSQPQT